MNPGTPTPPAARRVWIAHFGSLRSALACMALLGAAVLAGALPGVPAAWALGSALALLTGNMAAALVVHPAFRRQLPLLVAHLALLSLVLLVGVGRLTALDGRFELTQGVEFDGGIIEANAGPWRQDAAAGLARAGLRHDGFEIDYAPGRRRGATRNRVHWRGADGTAHAAVIGDHRPLVLDGTRIYTTPNKGFAPVLTWTPARGPAVTGAVHLPAYPMHELRQSSAWHLPDGRRVWVQLDVDETLIDPSRAAAFRLPETHRLTVHVDRQRAELAPGGTLDLDAGALRYDELRTWMGYRVTRDATLPWLLASALLATFALAWHYAQRFWFRAPSVAAVPLVEHRGAVVLPVDRSVATVPPIDQRSAVPPNPAVHGAADA